MRFDMASFFLPCFIQVDKFLSRNIHKLIHTVDAVTVLLQLQIQGSDPNDDIDRSGLRNGRSRPSNEMHDMSSHKSVQ